MPTFTPVDGDPFASAAPAGTPRPGVTFTPVDHDPFAAAGGAPQDAGVNAAFAEGALDGVPILGPALEKAGDYVGSHIGSWISGKPVDQVLAEGQARKKATEDAHPVASVAGGITGGTMAMAPAVAAAPAMFGAGAPGAAGLLGQMGAGAITGAGIGAADGAVRSGGDLTDAVAGAGLGMLGGAAGPAIGSVAQRGLSALADSRAQSAALRGLGYSRPSADIIMRAAENDGTLGGQGVLNIRAGGPEAMLADAGPNMQGLLDASMQRGGPGVAAARQAIDHRAANAGQSLNVAMDNALGQPQGVQTATNAIRDASAPARQQAYDAAYAQPIDYSSPEGMTLEALMGRVPGSAISRANNLMRLEGNQSRQILAQIGDDGSVTYQRMPDVRQLDYITRALNDVAQRGDGQGALGGNTAEGRAYGNLSRAIRGTLRGAVPDYGTALDTAAEPIAQRNAVEFGSTMLRPSVARDVVADTTNGMSAAERQAVAQGVRSHIDENLANVQRTIQDPNVDARQAAAGVKALSSDAVREKLGMIGLDPQASQDMMTALGHAGQAINVRASVAQNSKTFPRLAIKEGVDAATEPGVLGQLAEGKPLDASKRMAQFLMETTPAHRAAQQDHIYGEITHALTGPRGDDAVNLLNALAAARARQAGANAAVARMPIRGAASTIMMGGVPVSIDMLTKHLSGG